MAPLSPYDLRTAAGRGPERFPAGHRWDSSPKIRFAQDSPLEQAGFEPSVPLGRERPKRSNEAVSVQITIAPSGARSLAAARLCSPSLSSLRRAELCAKHIYI